MEDQLKTIPRVVEKDIKSWAKGREGRVTGEGQIGGVGGVLLPEQLRTLAEVCPTANERAKGKHENAEQDVNATGKRLLRLTGAVLSS